MELTVSKADSAPIYQQLIDQIKEQIVQGQLRTGDPLPSMRLLAKELRISVITTKRAYEELEREGLVVSRTGQGTFVAEVELPALRQKQRCQAERALREAAACARRAGLTREVWDALCIKVFEEETQ